MSTTKLEQLEHTAVHLRWHAMRALVLRRFCRWCGVWWFLWGAMALGLRTVWGVNAWPVSVGGMAIPTLLLLAYLQERAATPSLAKFRAVVDDLSGSGGLLMAAGEGLPATAWLDSRQLLPLAPTLHWRARRLVALQVVGVVFLVLCLFGPTPRLRVVPIAAPILDLRAMLADYEGQIEVLAEEKILSPREEAELKAMAKRLAEEKSATNPESAWEALDSLRATIDGKARDAAERALEELVGAEQAKELMRELAKAVKEGRLDPEEALAAARELAKHIAARPGGEALAEELIAAMKRGELGAGGLRQLAEAAGAKGEEAARRLARLVDQGMLEEGQAGLAEAMGKERAKAQAALAEFLAQQNGEGGEACALGQALGQQDGQWAVARGPGHAPLSWTGGSSEEGASFKETTLTSKRPEDMSESHLVATDRTAPKTLGGPVATEAGHLKGASAAGGSARTHRVLPRHRRTVATFFNRPPPTGKKTP